MPLKHTLKELTLDNGVKGLLIHVYGAPAFHYKIHFRAGYNAVDTPMTQQVAHVLEHILYGWTNDSRYPTKAAFLNDVFRNGAFVNATTNLDGSWYYGNNVLSEWKRILKLRKIALTNPRFSDDAVAAEKGNAADEIRSNTNNYERLSNELISKALSYNGQTSQEKIDSIESITAADISSFYERTYTLRNMRFILAGDLAESEALIMEYFSSWELPGGERITNRTLDAYDASHLSYEYVPSIANVYFYIAFKVERRLDAGEFQAMKALNNFLFNVQNARVLEEARRQGICYRMQGYVDGSDTGTLWAIGAPVSVANMSALFRLIRDGLRYVIEQGLTGEQFTSLMAYTKGKYEQEGQTVEGLASMHLGSYFDDESIWPTNDTSAMLEGVSAEAIRRLAREFLTSRIWVMTGVGSAEQAAYASERDEFVKFLERVE